MQLAPNQVKYIQEHYVNPALSLLELKEPFTPGQLKEAYREKAKKYHPDKGGDQVTMARVIAAYEMLLGKPVMNMKLPGPQWPQQQMQWVIISVGTSYVETTSYGTTSGGWY